MNQLKKDPRYKQASQKMKNNNYNLALREFMGLSKKYPDVPQIWWDVALVQVQLEEFKQAETSIKKMLALDPSNEDGNSLLGYVHYRLENYKQAATAYDKVGGPEGSGVTFFDAKKAAERMKKSVGSR